MFVSPKNSYVENPMPKEIILGVNIGRGLSREGRAQLMELMPL